MRCKRCGELLEPMDTHCPVCGKTVSPRKKPAASRSSETSIKLPQLDKFTHAYHEDVSRSRTLQMVTIAAVVVVIALVVLVYVGVGEMQATVQDLRQTAEAQLQASQNQPAPDPTEEPTDPTQEQSEPPTEDDRPLPLNRQNVEAVLELYPTDSGTYAAAYMDLGDFEDRAVAWVNTVREGGTRWTNVAWILEDAGDRMDLGLRDSFDTGEGRYDVSLTWDLEGDTFDGLSGAVCLWEYRVVGGQWESLPSTYITPIGGGCEVSLTADQLSALLAQTTSLELRCLVSLSHPDGGTLTLTAGGIALSAQGLVTGGTLPG